VASHELKTPLTPLRLLVQGFGRKIRRGADPNGTMPAWLGELGTMDRQIVRFERLIDDLLDVSRISAGGLSLRVEEVQLAEVVREVVGRFRLELERVQYTVEVPDEAAPKGRWDRLRLDQVLTNLLSNALKYGEGKRVDIEARIERDRARIAVRDRGIGIPVEDQRRIFDRFQRLLPVRHYGGFGLGLWIVKQIVDAHGGKIFVTSRPGEGSTFEVELPLRPAEEVAAGNTRKGSRREHESGGRSDEKANLVGGG
jgi:signal transduction histidine kinase